MKRRRSKRIKPELNSFLLTEGPFKGKTVEFAPQESLGFVSDMADDFLARVLKHPGALITDESYITDFETWGERTERFRKQIIARAKKVYRVDISDVFDESLPKVLHFIQTKRPDGR